MTPVKRLDPRVAYAARAKNFSEKADVFPVSTVQGKSVQRFEKSILSATGNWNTGSDGPVFPVNSLFLIETSSQQSATTTIQSPLKCPADSSLVIAPTFPWLGLYFASNRRT